MTKFVTDIVIMLPALGVTKFVALIAIILVTFRCAAYAWPKLSKPNSDYVCHFVQGSQDKYSKYSP